MTQANNLTEGKVSRVMLGFYFPMLFTNLLQQIYSFADMAIVGKGLGDNALAAVGNMSALSLLIIGFSMGMTNGFSVIIAQSFGSGDYSALRKAIAGSVKLAAVITAALTVLSLTQLKNILVLIRTDEAILNDSLKYGSIIFAGLAATVAYNLCSSILRALGDSKTPFIAITASSALNIALDLLFVFALKSGVEGAAFATVFSQLISVLICMVKLRKMKIITLTYADFKSDRAVMLALLKNGIPAACMNSVTAVGCMLVQALINTRGVEYTSAYSACCKYINLFMLPSITAGFAVLPFVSQHIGSQAPDKEKLSRIKEGVHVGAGIAIASYALLGSVMFLFPETLAKTMLSGEKPIALAVEFLRLCGVMFFTLNLLFIYRNAVQGMGKPFIPMCSGFAEMGLRIAAIIILLPHIGFKAAAYAEIIAWIGALLLNYAAYRVFIGRMKKQLYIFTI